MSENDTNEMLMQNHNHHMKNHEGHSKQAGHGQAGHGAVSTFRQSA